MGPCRRLHYVNVPCQYVCCEHAASRSQLRSGALTFGTFPALVVAGKGVLNQTQAIARYVGHLTGMRLALHLRLV